MRRVLVTGSSRGIGMAIAENLAASGFAIGVHCRERRAEAMGVASRIESRGGRSWVLQFDVTDRADCERAIERDIAANGPWWGIVSNAGVTRDNTFAAIDEDDWDIVIKTGLYGFYNVVHPAIMPMVRAKQGGRIVTIASVSGMVGNRGQVNYSAAKGGLIAATKALALELASREITVNCVAPGLIDTKMMEDAPVEEILKHVPMGRVGTPLEVAATVNFLFSENAGYITRQVIGVNGGLA